MLALKRQNLLAIVFFCCFIHSKSRSISVSQIGDVRIEITDAKWLCDKIECPIDANRCYVSKVNDPKDPSILMRTNICYSKDNQELAQSVTTSKIDPNNKIKVEINSGPSGTISSVNSFNGSGDFDEEKFNEDLQKNLSNINKQVHDQVANINKQVNENLDQLSYNLSHMFD